MASGRLLLCQPLKARFAAFWVRSYAIVMNLCVLLLPVQIVHH